MLGIHSPLSISAVLPKPVWLPFNICGIFFGCLVFSDSYGQIVTVHTCVPSNGILSMLRIPNRQNLLPELYRTEFSVQKIPTCEQLRQILSVCAASFKWRETLYVVSGFKVNVFFTFLWQITFSFNFSLIFMWAFYKLFCFFFPIFINFGWYKIFNFLQFC